MHCTRCGVETKPDAKFCANCGHNLSGGASLPPPAGLPRTPRDDVRNATCPNCEHTAPGDGLFCQHCEQFLRGPKGMLAASVMRRFAAILLDVVLFFLTLVIGYVVWSLIVFKNGETPGKQLVGIRAIREDGQPAGWMLTFLRELGVKWLLVNILASFTLGIARVADFAWAFFDEDRQALHDKLVQTVVVYTG